MSITPQSLKLHCEALQRHNLYPTGALALLLCQQREPTMNEIGAACGTTSAGATNIVDSLEKRKLVIRGHDPADRRKITVFLTEGGGKLLSDISNETPVL